MESVQMKIKFKKLQVVFLHFIKILSENASYAKFKIVNIVLNSKKMIYQNALCMQISINLI